jgi:hypothetical protein
MRNFLDDSGAFAWAPPGISLFAGLILSNWSTPRITEAFIEWKRKILSVGDDVEVKGKNLRSEHLMPFVKWVVLPHKGFWISLTGADTRLSTTEISRQYVEQAAEVVEAAGGWASGQGNQQLGTDYRRMAKWMRGRSPQNGLWISVLSRSIHRTIQHTIARHLEPSVAVEYEDWEIVIDQSFVKKPKELTAWRAWLRSDLHRICKTHPIIVPTQWPEDHPYMKRFRVDGDSADMSDLFRTNMTFGDSQAHYGLQMADICASICRRYFAGEMILPYEALHPRIVQDKTTDMLVIYLNEGSLRQGPPEESFNFIDVPPASEIPEPASDEPVSA